MATEPIPDDFDATLKVASPWPSSLRTSQSLPALPATLTPYRSRTSPASASLPCAWRTPAERREAVERDHCDRHHGHPRIRLSQCHLCAEEGGWVM